ncbi:MAG TPA: hypothetical protein VIN02_04240, partial [Sulfurovum sp.]
LFYHTLCVEEYTKCFCYDLIINKLVYFYTMTLIFFSRCVRVVIAPIDVADTAVDAVSDTEVEEKED